MKKLRPLYAAKDRLMIKAVIFDFGGVLAEEGFREGLQAIADKNGLECDLFFETARELIYHGGYVTGQSREPDFWTDLREKAGIRGSDNELRHEILKRFVLREKVLRIVKKISFAGLITAILSDQTNWLDEINEREPFYHLFDFIFNSYDIKKSKRDPSVFGDVCSVMGLKPDEAVFVDDNAANIRNASDAGFRIIHFINVNQFEREIEGIM
jgi:putative hydrolase of the HAD superfamily